MKTFLSSFHFLIALMPLSAVAETTSITVTIDRVDVNDRKMSLGTGDSPDDSGWQEFSGGTADSLGSLGDRLKEALSRQKKGG